MDWTSLTGFRKSDIENLPVEQGGLSAVAWHCHTHRPIYLRHEMELLGDAPVCLRDLIALRLGLKCGLRPPEIRFQRAEKVNYEDRILCTHPCKGHPSRPVPVDATTLKLIGEYSSGEGVLIRAKEGYETRSGNQISDVLLFDIVKNAARRAGIPGWQRVYPYLLRHYFASKWVLEKGSIETLRRILGHDSLTSTQSYLSQLIWWEDVEHDYERIVEAGKMEGEVLHDGGASGQTKVLVEILTPDRGHALEILKDLNDALLPSLAKHSTARLRVNLSPEPEDQNLKEGES